jgi:NAD(P)-dependent dehydrogenase (short-subunit alcohol dehydrogenase family)
MNFAGKRALVTGAAGGIGGSITSMLRAAGARVAVTDRNTDGIDAEAHFPGDLTDS